MEIKLSGKFDTFGNKRSSAIEKRSGFSLPYTKVINVSEVIHKNIGTKNIGRVKLRVRNRDGDVVHYFKDVTMLSDLNLLTDRVTGESLHPFFSLKNSAIHFVLYDFNPSIDEQQELMKLVLDGTF